jgi:hypothetical protein
LLVLPFVLAGCIDRSETRFVRLDLTPDRRLGGTDGFGIVRSVIELPDGRAIVAPYFRPELSLLDTAGNVVDRLPTIELGGVPFAQVTSVGRTSDGRIFVLDGQRNALHALRVTGNELVRDRSIDTHMLGHTMRMCVAGNRIFVTGARDANDSTVLHEIDENGVAINSFGRPRNRDVVEMRKLRLAQLECSDKHIVLAPPGASYIIFFDLDGAQQAVLPIPGRDDVVYDKSRDPLEPRIRRTEFNGWNSVQYAPDGTLFVQYEHYKGQRFDRMITNSLSEAGTWRARPDRLPRLIAVGRRYAYAADAETFSILTRYRYKAR